MIRVAVHGAGGRMGRRIVQLLEGHSELRLAAAIERVGSPYLGADAGVLSGVEATGVKIVGAEALQEALRDVDVVIDFTGPDATAGLLMACIANGLPTVVGSTGWGDDVVESLGQLSARAPVLVAANMSPGVTVLTHLAALAVRLLGPEYDAEIVEMHHRAKVDAPSGTAMQLARAVADAKGLDLASAGRFGRSGRPGPRQDAEIGVLALRGGDVVGDHTLVLAGPGERLELTHRAHDRGLFAQGALRAAAWLVRQPAGLYSMTDAIGVTE